MLADGSVSIFLTYTFTKQSCHCQVSWLWNSAVRQDKIMIRYNPGVTIYKDRFDYTLNKPYDHSVHKITLPNCHYCCLRHDGELLWFLIVTEEHKIRKIIGSKNLSTALST